MRVITVLGRLILGGFLLVQGTGCRALLSNPDLLHTAIMATAVTIAVAESRADGGCYAACTNGTSCDPQTGYCLRAPCRGECRADEFCESGPREERCVPHPATDHLIVTAESCPVAGP